MSHEVTLQFTNTGIEIIGPEIPPNFISLLKGMEKDGVKTDGWERFLCG